MIHTDGKPTIAHYPGRMPGESEGQATLRRKLYDAEKRLREAEERIKRLDAIIAYRKYPEPESPHCPCAECAELDPDALPGGYDNPADPIDWNLDDCDL